MAPYGNETLKKTNGESKCQRTLYEYHDSELACHPGIEETLRAIRQHHRWPKMKQEITGYVQLCHLCACTKNASGPAPELRPRRPKEPWDTIAVDLIGPYPLQS